MSCSCTAGFTEDVSSTIRANVLNARRNTVLYRHWSCMLSVVCTRNSTRRLKIVTVIGRRMSNVGRMP